MLIVLKKKATGWSLGLSSLKYMSKIIKKPEKTNLDHWHTLGRASLSAMPIIGGPVVELFNELIIPPISKRRDKWIIAIANKLIELEKKVNKFKIDNLKGNDIFVTTVLNATQIAIRNHQREKIHALKNIVYNTALANKPDEDKILVFLNYIDSFTTWHIKLLTFFNDPERYGIEHNIDYPDWSSGGVSNVLEYTFPEVEREFYDLIVKDLFSRGLISTDNIHATMTKSGMFASRTSHPGDEFIDFISDYDRR